MYASHTRSGARMLGIALAVNRCVEGSIPSLATTTCGTIQLPPTPNTKEKVMAQKILVELLDDIDGSDAVDTFEFTHNGVTYAADFNQAHMDEYTQVFEYLTSIARVVKGKKRAPYGSKKGTTPVVGKTQEMREWLRNAGHDVKDRGRVPAHLQNLYNMRPRTAEAEKPVEAVEAKEAPKAPTKVAAPRKKATQAPKSPATQELAKLLAFKEPEAPKKARATRAKATTPKV